MILDLGSGIPSPAHISFNERNVIHVDISRAGYHLEVQCDAHYLPFQDESFQIIYASHILEHVTHPYNVLKEISRVTKNYAVIKVPNSNHYKQIFESPNHIYGWTKYNLNNLLKLFFKKVTISESNRITHLTSDSIFKRKMQTLKMYLISMLN